MYVTRCYGFTLIELAVTLAVGAILLALATPSLQRIINDNRLSAQANTLLSSLALARSEAIKRGQRVTVCKSADGISCSTTDAWSDGWLVFTDPTSPGSLDVGETVLARGEPLSGASTLTTRNGRLEHYIAYRANGLSQGGPGPGSDDEFKLCDPAGAAAMRLITLNAVGRPSLSKGDPACL